MTKLSLEKIHKETIWVAKMQGYRMTGTYDEMKSYAESEDCRDFDIAAKQPDSLADFYDKYFAYDEEHGFITIDDFYNTVYAPKKVWTEEKIKSLIQTNDKVLYGALKKLYAEQTANEQVSSETKERNGKGFNSVDAHFLTSVTQFYLRTGYLTTKQKFYARKKLVKYNKQLTRLANAS